MLNSSLLPLSDAEASIISSMQDIQRFATHIMMDEYEIMPTITTNTKIEKENIEITEIKIPKKTLLYKAQHHLESNKHNLCKHLILPDIYIDNILFCLDSLQNQPNITQKYIQALIQSLQALLEYLRHQISIGLQQNNQLKYISYLYFSYAHLNITFNLTYLDLEDFLKLTYNENNKNSDKNIISNSDKNIDFYYAKYNLDDLLCISNYLKNIQNNWDADKNKELFKKDILSILNIVKKMCWYDMQRLIQVIFDIAHNETNILDSNTLNKNNTPISIAIASTLLFIEYICAEPWRIYEMTQPNVAYKFSAVIDALIQQIQPKKIMPDMQKIPDVLINNACIDLYELHKHIYGYKAFNAVLNQVYILVQDAQINLNKNIHISLDNIKQIQIILQNIGFIDENNVLKDLICKFELLNINTNNNKHANTINAKEENIAYIYYILGGLPQYIQNKYAQEQQQTNNLDKNESSEDEDWFYAEKEQKEAQHQIKNILENCKYNPFNYEVNHALYIENLIQISKKFHSLKNIFKTVNLFNYVPCCGYIEQICNYYIHELTLKHKIHNNIENNLSMQHTNISFTEKLSILVQFIEKAMLYLNMDKQTNQIYLNTDITVLEKNCIDYLAKIQEKSNNNASIKTNAKPIINDAILAIYKIEAQDLLKKINAYIDTNCNKDGVISLTLNTPYLLSKILHQIKGCSTTIQCISMQNWCIYFDKLYQQKYIKSTHLELLRYNLLAAIDIVNNLSIEKLSYELEHSSIVLFEKILNDDNKEENRADDKNTTLKNIVPIDAELMNLFMEEAQSLHNLIDENIINIYKDTKATQDILRAIHTLKGGARMVLLNDLGDMYHALEDMIEQNNALNIIQSNITMIKQALNHQTQNIILNNVNLMNTSEDVSKNNSENKNIYAKKSFDETWHVKLDNKKLSSFMQKSYHIENLIGQLNVKLDDFSIQIHNTLQPLQKNEQILEGILRLERKNYSKENQKKTENNIYINSHNLEFDTLELDRYSEPEQQIKSAQAINDYALKNQEYLEGYLHQIQDLFKSLHYASKDLHENLTHLSLLSFVQIIPKLKQTCEQAAAEENKQVILQVQGESICVNKIILEACSFAFEHLIRNSIKHGIENKDVRKNLNKTEHGNISIHIQQQSEYMHITFRDDGQGLNLYAVRQKAIKLGWISEEDEVSLTQLLHFITQTGFSTSDNISKAAGRGIGLDVVFNYIQKNGGEISINSEPEHSFTVKIIFRLQSFISDILVCKGNGKEDTFGLLVNSIEKIDNGDNSDNEDNDKILQIKNNRINHINDISIDQLFNPKNTVFVQYIDEAIQQKYIVIPYNNLRYNIAVQHIRLHKAMYIRNAPVPYHNPSLVGVGMINFSELLPVYNLELLLSNFLKIDDNPSQNQNQNNVHNEFDTTYNNSIQNSMNKNMHIMLVDDSSVIRSSTQKILKNSNYQVTLAVNGEDAIMKLNNMHKILASKQNMDTHTQMGVDLFLIDIEMPTMNGFELIQYLRKHEKYAHTPIIVISSRQTDKYQQQAYDLGANDFLGKPYQSKELIAHIARELTKHKTYH